MVQIACLVSIPPSQPRGGGGYTLSKESDDFVRMSDFLYKSFWHRRVGEGGYIVRRGVWGPWHEVKALYIGIYTPDKSSSLGNVTIKERYMSL